MFIGASPSSVGGGIRTTTFAVVLLTIFSFAKGKSEVRVFNRRLANEDIMKSFIVFSSAVMLVIGCILYLGSQEYESISFIAIIFEVCSAFGTSGLSMGITANLTSIGKLVIILLMFIGRIGLLTFLLFSINTAVKSKVKYPEERIIIG